MNEVIDAIKFLYQQGIIDDAQFQNYYNMCNEPNINFDVIKTQLKKIYDNYKSGNKSELVDYDFDIIDVDDGDRAMFTGIIPISMIRDDLNDYEEIGDDSSLSNQKTLGSHPGVGSHFHFGEDGGFMTFIFTIFLAGISSGIIFMIILNFFAK